MKINIFKENKWEKITANIQKAVETHGKTMLEKGIEIAKKGTEIGKDLAIRTSRSSVAAAKAAVEASLARASR